ncbi:hypothetical protein BC826DRAFT_1009522 [Russula brevipes]|nr:hypothetical protein BC826DRAFT_1009522 [Russula brevipes]
MSFSRKKNEKYRTQAAPQSAPFSRDSDIQSTQNVPGTYNQLSTSLRVPANSPPSNSSSTSGLTPHSTQQLPSQSQSHPPLQRHRQPPVYPWFARRLNLLPPTLLSENAPTSGPSPSPFPRYGHALPACATGAGELFLFGGLIPSPRVGHAGALVSSVLLIWGGDTNASGQGGQVLNEPQDDSLYLLNLVSREWARVVINGPGPVGRYGHAVTMVGSKFFVFGGQVDGEFLNDMWSFDLNTLKSKPVWESCEPAPGDEKPPRRTGHASVTHGDRIIIFGGTDGRYHYNDTWMFDISTRKWTELQCTGYIPSPREGHAAALVDDMMYVFGGRGVDGTDLGDLTAYKLSTQRWFMFQNMGPSPSRRSGHAMASHGTRVFVLGGEALAEGQADDTALIHVLNTKYIKYRKSDPSAVRPSEKFRLERKSSTGVPAQEQSQRATSDTDTARAAASPFQQAASPAELRRAGPYGLPSQPTGLNVVPEEDGDSEGSTEHRAAALETAAKGGLAQSERKRQMSAMFAAQAERDRLVEQLSDARTLKSTLFEPAEANAVEAAKRAGLLQEMHTHVLQDQTGVQGGSAALDAELREQADRLFAQTSPAEQKGTTVLNLPARLDEFLHSRDQHMRALEQAQVALRKATTLAAELDEERERIIEQYKTELAEVRSELETRMSELKVVRIQLADAEDALAKSRAQSWWPL